MLEQLDIRNLALIEDIHINFTEGFNVLTGETGAGKSIILGALELLLGEKGDSSFIRSGSSEASVAATFSIGKSKSLLKWVKEKELDENDQKLVIRRSIKSSGRGSIYIQGELSTRGDLEFIGKELFDMHGQHEHQSLLFSDRQRRVLDNFASLEPSVESYANEYRILEERKKELEQLFKERQQSLKEEDYLRFVVNELSEAGLKIDEEDSLRDEISSMVHYEVIQDNLELLYGSLRASGGDKALDNLASALQSIRKISKVDSTFEQLEGRLESAFIEIEDIADTTKERLNSLSFSQFLLDEKQNRLALIQRLKRKYGPTLENVISFLDESKNKLDNLENSTDNLTKTEKIIKEQEIVVSNLEQSLSNKRKEAAKKLEKLIQSRLSLLGMPDVNFCVEVKQGERRFSGIDYINFLFSANLGEPLKNLKEIASGGELSRVMLAIKTVLSEADDIQTLVFDEVDAGIGGKVALAVGSQMAELAKSRQVIAITHLASIASKAQTHFVVNKETIGGRTYTKIGEVSSSERVKELARMLSGDKEGEAAIKHAETLIN